MGLPESIAGTLYVYKDEDGDAIAVARNAVGPNGGWTADSIAKIAMPSDRVTREELNAYARKFAACDALYAQLERAAELLERVGCDQQFRNVARVSREVLAQARGEQSA